MDDLVILAQRQTYLPEGLHKLLDCLHEGLGRRARDKRGHHFDGGGCPPPAWRYDGGLRRTPRAPCWRSRVRVASRTAVVDVGMDDLDSGRDPAPGRGRGDGRGRGARD